MNDMFCASLSFGNTLIVKGNLNIRGSFQFYGLVIVVTDGKNEAKINCMAGRNSFIYGVPSSRQEPIQRSILVV